MMRRLLLLAALNLTAIAPLHAEQGAYMLRSAALHHEPYSDARIVTELKPREVLTILERRGGWYQARTTEQQLGWVRMSTIRLGEPGTGGQNVSETLRILRSGRSNADGVTVATGIRGLDTADMANATPNHQAVKHLGRYQADAAQARTYAAQGKLNSRQRPYIKNDNRDTDTIPGISEDW